jgi:hypothetical protein
MRVSDGRRSLLRAARRLSAALAGTLLLAVSGGGATPGAAASDGTPPASGCDLKARDGRVKHVVSVVFDNTHLTRDNPAVPSDLEQMPNLLNFITGGGTMISHEHTPLIAHTGTDILSSLTGVYGDRMGQPISNSFGFYDTDRAASFRSTFAYWTARLGGVNDNSYFMTTPDGHNAPAPWVPYTRAGCSYGAVASANTVLENTRTDIPTVFGPGSPEDQELQASLAIPCGFGSNPPCTPEQQKAKNQPQADFVGLAVHCGRNDRRCAGATGARPDVLPDEPGGYTGFSGLFGARYVDPLASPGGPVTDLDGNVIADPTGNLGFPGFDSMSASTSLGLVAALQEHGVPVTSAYISDAHDDHRAGRAFGPGEAGYVQQLKSYDDAFGKFFERLRRDGITKDNTLFVFTADENDHFVGGPPSQAGCDGVHVACTYQQIGELNVNLSGLLGAVPPYSAGTPVPGMSVHADSAPNVYLDGNPSQTDPLTRSVERAAKHVQAVSPITHETDHVTNFLAGAAAMSNLHMLTGDARRNPTFTLFANPDYFVCATGFSCAPKGTQVIENPAFAWNHGDFAPDIDTTWLGLVGPGVRHLGVDAGTWSSHTDIRPTTLALLGLRDDYRHQGRVLVEAVEPGALPAGLGDVAAYRRLAQVYEQVDSPVGQFGRASLILSTTALASGDGGDDSVYAASTARLQQLGRARDALAGEMNEVLDRPVSTAVPDRERPGRSALADRGFDLLQEAWLASNQ